MTAMATPTTATLPIRDYALVTAGYWAFTLTDGALRMLVLLHFHELGYSPVALAFLFLLYETMGIVTNLVKWTVGRSRPLRFDDDGVLTLSPISFGFEHVSFPSGHTTRMRSGSSRPMVRKNSRSK